MSLWFDLYLLIKTILVLIKREDVYLTKEKHMNYNGNKKLRSSY